jgi:hypothetical protein
LIPGGDSKHQICVGYFFVVDWLTYFSFESISTISSGFGHSALVYTVNRLQYDVELMVLYRISKHTVGVFAQVYLF